MKRRGFLKGAAVAGLAGATASSLPAPAVSQGIKRWRMVTTWPKNFPGLGTGAELLAQLIERGTEGKLQVTVFGGGEVVKPFDSLEAVAGGEVEMGHGAPYYWKKQVPAVQFMAG
ncbi:MAG: twin-arginine translocation signal domain-containing protein, partial [Kiloniellales bacterium]|nr:twin-arginine translocation signal domain-containing protein [Kiloniellales bacterium]